MAKFLVKDVDGNAAAIVYAEDAERARAEYVVNSAVKNTDVFKIEVEDITDVPVIGEVGIDDREIGG